MQGKKMSESLDGRFEYSEFIKPANDKMDGQFAELCSGHSIES